MSGHFVHTDGVTSEAVDGESQPASEVYAATVAKLDRNYLVDLAFAIFEILFWVWLPDDMPEPRYRILISRCDATDAVGVETARTRRAAERALVQVQAALDNVTAMEARRRWDLPA